MAKNMPRILSCFVDETGDFGDYDSHCPYYMVSVVLHDQSESIETQLKGMEKYLSDLRYPHHAIHAGPLVRREADYMNLQMEDRKRIFNLLFNFARKVPIRYFCAKVRKSECRDADDLDAKLTKAIKTKFRKMKRFPAIYRIAGNPVLFRSLGNDEEPSRIALVLKLRILFVIIRMLIRPVRQNSTALLI